MPWFGKKKQEKPPVSKLLVAQHKEYRIPNVAKVKNSSNIRCSPEKGEVISRNE